MNIQNDNIDDETARAMLDQYLTCDYYSDLTMPKKIRKEFLVEYLRENVGADRKPTTFQQALNLVVFYGAAESLEYFSEFLNKGESTNEDYSRSLSIVSMLALAGAEKDRKFGYDYLHQHLLNHDLAQDQLQPLLLTLTDLGPTSSFVQFETLAETKKKSLDSAKGDSDEGYILNQDFLRFYRNDVPRAQKALETRKKIESLTPNERVAALIRVYLQLEPVPGGFIDRWVIAQLMRLAESKQDAKPNLIDSARLVLENEKQADKLDEQTEDFCRLRVIRLIEFIDATQLTEKEQAFLRQHAEHGQDDPISLVQPVL